MHAGPLSKETKDNTYMDPWLNWWQQERDFSSFLDFISVITVTDVSMYGMIDGWWMHVPSIDWMKKKYYG
jgi:hypothetical protein